MSNKALQKVVKKWLKKIKRENLNRVYSAQYPLKINKVIQIPLQIQKSANKICHLRILNQQKEKAAAAKVFLEINLKIQEMKKILKPNVTATNLSLQIL